MDRDAKDFANRSKIIKRCIRHALNAGDANVLSLTSHHVEERNASLPG